MLIVFFCDLHALKMHFDSAVSTYVDLLKNKRGINYSGDQGFNAISPPWQEAPDQKNVFAVLTRMTNEMMLVIETMRPLIEVCGLGDPIFLPSSCRESLGESSRIPMDSQLNPFLETK